MRDYHGGEKFYLQATPAGARGLQACLILLVLADSAFSQEGTASWPETRSGLVPARRRSHR
jgi:hypothetical protein